MRSLNVRFKDFALVEGDEDLIKKIKPAYAQAMSMAGSMDSLAADLNVPVGTIKSRRHRGRKALLALRTHG